MKNKNLYGTFLKISISILIIVSIICVWQKVDEEVLYSIFAIYMVLMLIMLFISTLIVEPKKNYELTKLYNEKVDYRDESLDSFIDELLSDTNVKKLHKRRNILAPIIILPLTIILTNVTRIACENAYQINYSSGVIFYQNCVSAFLVVLLIYSFYTWFKLENKIINYLEDKIFNFFAGKYQMEEIDKDELAVDVSKTYATSNLKEQLKSDVSNIFRDKNNLFGKRIFLLHLYKIIKGGRVDRITCFYGLCMILPHIRKTLFYKTQNYKDMTYRIDNDYFNNSFENDMNSNLEKELEKVYKRYNKEFKISSVTGKIQIFCEQELEISAHYSRMEVYVRDYCNAMNFLFELSEAIENEYGGESNG